MPETTERTEYRVVGFNDGSGGATVSTKIGWARRMVNAALHNGHPEVRIQTRTVTETPWVDLDEEEGK